MGNDPAVVSAEPSRGPAPEKTAGGTRLVRWFEYALLAFVVAGIVRTVQFAALRVSLPFTLNYEEGNDLNAALRIAHGLNPYPPVGGPPYVVNPYGPVFYYALAPLLKWFGAGFTAPRWFVFACALAVALLLVLLLRRWTESWLAALCFGLFFLAVSLVRDWSYVLRVDFVGLALTVAGLYAFARSGRLCWPAALFTAALFTKPDLIAAPAACFLYSWLARDRLRAWRFAAWVAGFGLAGVAALGMATRGWGLFHMFLTHTDPYSFRHYFATIGPFALLEIPLLIAVAALAYGDFRSRRWSLPLLYFASASVMSLTAGKFGSDYNHLLEWQAAVCLAAGCGYRELRSRSRADAALALLPIGIAVVILLGFLESPRPSQAFRGCEAAYRLAAGQPGELLAEDIGAAALSGKTVWISSLFEFHFLGKDGRLNQQPLAEMVRNRFFSLILLGETLPDLERRAAHPQDIDTVWPPPFVSALASNYHPVARFACPYASVAYVPNAQRP